MDNLVGFAYGYAWMSREEWFEVVSTELTSLLNQPICKEKIVVIRPVFTDIGALGYAVLAFDEPVTLEQVLEMDKNLPQALHDMINQGEEITEEEAIDDFAYPLMEEKGVDEK